MRRKKMIILPKLNAPEGENQKWFVYFSVRNPRTDKMVRFKRSGQLNSIKSEKTRREEADRMIEEYRQKLKAGWTPYVDDVEVIYEDNLKYCGVSDIYNTKRASNRTLNYYSNKFLEHIKGEIRSATLHTYTSKIRTLNAWVDARGDAQNDISAVSNNEIVEFFQFLINERKLSGNSITKYKQILFSLFEYVVEFGHLRLNPVYNLPKCNRINDQAARPVYQNDIKQFKEVIAETDPQLWMAIEFEFYCYIRPGTELRLLKIGDIDFARGLIFIGREHFKTKRENVKEIPRHFLNKIRNDYQLHTYPRDYYVFSQNRKPGPEHLGKNNLRFRFNKFRQALNMPQEYKFYSWKHTGGVLASESGIPEKDISDQMGHTSLNTTSQYLKSKGGRRILSIRDRYPEL
jgi:integrase